MKAAIIIALVCVVVGVHGGLVLPLGSRQANHPVDNTPELSQILSYENDNIGIGPYNFEYVTKKNKKECVSNDIRTNKMKFTNSIN